MNPQFSNLAQIEILTRLISISDKDRCVDFQEPKNPEVLDAVFKDGRVEDYLLELSEKHILTFDIVGEDGFKPIMLLYLKNETDSYLNSLILEAEEEKKSLESKILQLESKITEQEKKSNERIANLLSFDPNALLNDIAKTERSISEIHERVKSDKVLAPISESLHLVSSHVQSIKVVATDYDDIYKNVIRPIQEEGKSGIRATVKWAIISIILSTVISLGISNYSDIKRFLGIQSQSQQSKKPIPNQNERPR